MNTIKQTYLIDASPGEVWRALTEPEMIELWSDADAEFEPRQGAEYALWDGSIVGEVVAVVPRKKLAMTWQPGYWTIEDSLVTFTLTPVGKKTRIDLLHENVEAFDYEGTREGWDAYYLGAIKRMLDAKKTRNTKLAKKAKAAKGKIAKKAKAVKGKSAGKKSGVKRKTRARKPRQAR
ncbi:MAG: SRPBCC domain-containing protein [Anaerolineales bacterium]|nr:SRPBCC domain-containing protein [Anaerolineales bacterium]